jgi:hypothetical protein
VNSTLRPPLTPKEIPWYSFLFVAEWTSVLNAGCRNRKLESRLIVGYWLKKVKNTIKYVMIPSNIKTQRMVQNLWVKQTDGFMEIL